LIPQGEIEGKGNGDFLLYRVNVAAGIPLQRLWWRDWSACAAAQPFQRDLKLMFGGQRDRSGSAAFHADLAAGKAA
jgi:hypothetical protein